MGGNHLLLLGYKKNPNDVIWPLNLQTSEHLMSDIYLYYVPQNLDEYQILIKDLG